MTSVDMPNIVMVNMDLMQAFLDDGTYIPITNMIDEFGDDTDNIEEAAAIIVGEEGRGWQCLSLANFGDITHH